MNTYHQELLAELKNHAGEGTKTQAVSEKKCDGTRKFCYVIKVPVKRQIVIKFKKKHPLLTFPDYLALLNSLFQGRSHDEFSLGSKLLAYFPKLRKQLEPQALDAWLNRAEGWAEVDGICQSSFTAEELLDDWPIWQALLAKWSKDSNVHKRRACLVLLTGPVRKSSDPRLADLTLANIERLKGDKHILITKAISWLLRDLVKNHRQKVISYIDQNTVSLPKIALRETRTKLLTGLKTPRKNRFEVLST